MNQRLDQMGKDCIELIKKKLERKLSKDEYYLALLELDKKYPMPGHNPPLTYYHYRHPERFKVIGEHEHCKFIHKIMPLNFKEAAEFYAQKNKEDPPQVSWVDHEPGQEG